MRGKLKTLFFIFIAGSGWAWGQIATGEELQLEILLKLLSKNANLNLAEVDTVGLSIVYDTANNRLENLAEKYYQTLSSFHKYPFSGKTLKVRKQSIENPEKITWQKIQAIIIIPGSKKDISPLLKKCAETQTLSLSTDSTLCNRGVSIAVDFGKAAQPEIWFNLTSLNNEGASYEREILQLVQHMKW